MVSLNSMKSNKKYTLELDESLVKSALKATGKNFTETVRQGLKIVASAESYQALSEMRGKLDLVLDTKALRKDRRDLR